MVYSLTNVQVKWGHTYQVPFLWTAETKLRVFNLNFSIEGLQQTTSFLRWFPSDTHLFLERRSTQTSRNNCSQWTSAGKYTTLFPQALCLSLIDNIPNLLLHDFLLIILINLLMIISLLSSVTQ